MEEIMKKTIVGLSLLMLSVSSFATTLIECSINGEQDLLITTDRNVKVMSINSDSVVGALFNQNNKLFSYHNMQQTENGFQIVNRHFDYNDSMYRFSSNQYGTINLIEQYNGWRLSFTSYHGYRYGYDRFGNYTRIPDIREDAHFFFHKNECRKFAY